MPSEKVRQRLRVEVDEQHAVAQLNQGRAQEATVVVLATPPFWLATASVVLIADHHAGSDNGRRVDTCDGFCNPVSHVSPNLSAGNRPGHRPYRRNRTRVRASARRPRPRPGAGRPRPGPARRTGPSNSARSTTSRSRCWSPTWSTRTSGSRSSRGCPTRAADRGAGQQRRLRAQVPVPGQPGRRRAGDARRTRHRAAAAQPRGARGHGRARPRRRHQRVQRGVVPPARDVRRSEGVAEQLQRVGGQRVPRPGRARDDGVPRLHKTEFHQRMDVRRGTGFLWMEADFLVREGPPRTTRPRPGLLRARGRQYQASPRRSARAVPTRDAPDASSPSAVS